MGEQMFVCRSVGVWRDSGNPYPCMDLGEIWDTHPHMSKEDFGAGLTPAPSPSTGEGWGGQVRLG